MNRIETKIIIMITNRLSSAKDSDAKTEMIEELSENLYQRYLELIADNIPEDEALNKAMESLGDVEELLAFLKEAEAEVQSEPSVSEKETSQENAHSSSMKGDLESGIEEIVNAAFTTARVAVDCARDVARDVSDQFKGKYTDGMFTGFSGKRGKKVDCTAIPADYVRSLELHLTNGSIHVCLFGEENAFIEVHGDTEEIETMLKDNGVLSITQGNTASAAYFFMRGMRRSDIEIRLPQKQWEKVSISTVNGDVHVEDGLECRELNTSATSGDLELKKITSGQITCRSSSGDITGSELAGDFHGETKSGDIEISGEFGSCELFSASGDITFEGEARELSCASTSGDLTLSLTEIPEKAGGNSISGDCVIKAAEGDFRLIYRTVSGKFRTNLPFTGALGEKQGDAVHGEQTSNEMQFSSVSGDIELCGLE